MKLEQLTQGERSSIQLKSPRKKSKRRDFAPRRTRCKILTLRVEESEFGLVTRTNHRRPTSALTAPLGEEVLEEAAEVEEELAEVARTKILHPALSKRDYQSLTDLSGTDLVLVLINGVKNYDQ